MHSRREIIIIFYIPQKKLIGSRLKITLKYTVTS